jgi:hypothetical protein
MTNINCNQFEQSLVEQDAGPLPASALAHIEVCADCRDLMADFDAIHDMAMELGSEGIAPPEHVWVSLRNQLEADGLIYEPLSAPQEIKGGWWTAFQRPALAGAFLALILVSAALMGYRGNPTQMAIHPQLALNQETSTVPTAETVFKEEMLTVGDQSIPGFQARDAAVADSIRRNLGIVDNFIAICEKSVREQPENEMAREYLYGAYEQKAELLATATNRSTMGGLQ